MKGLKAAPPIHRPFTARFDQRGSKEEEMDYFDEEESVDFSVGKAPIAVDIEKDVMKITKMHKVNEKESSHHSYGLCS